MAVGHYQGHSATLSVLTRPAPTLLASCSFTAIEPSAPFVAVALNTDGSAEATATPARISTSQVISTVDWHNSPTDEASLGSAQEGDDLTDVLRHADALQRRVANDVVAGNWHALE